MTVILQIVLGGMLLFFGGRMTWLLAAVVGWIAGSVLVALVMPDASDMMTLAVSGGIALLFGLLVGALGKTLLGVIGFIAGGIGLVALANVMGMDLQAQGTLVTAAAFGIGAVAGAFLLTRLLGLGIVLLSSLLGALMIVAGLAGQTVQAGALPDGSSGIFLAVLFGVGVLAQLLITRRR